MRRSALLIPLLAATAGCMNGGGMAGPTPPASVKTVSATLASGTGVPMGTARITEEAGGLRLVVNAKGLPPGSHGLHIHTTGRCDVSTFTTAGGHWNPTGMVHGKDAAGGPHRGDLPNLIAGADGSGRLETLVPGAAIDSGPAPLMDADGAALVIHAAPDDYMTDPSGNSGARIACGVFAPG